jgi:imidazole glycerol-phosphate synthase subunit HisF
LLARRLIPCFDVKNGRVVKGTKFLNLRDAGDAVELAAFYDEQGADEMVFLDIMASFEGRGTLIDFARRVAERIYVPFTVGGGVSSVEQYRELLNAGAEKVAINTAAHKDPMLIRRAADRFGSQCVVVAIDARRVDPAEGSSGVNGVEPGNSEESAPWWEVYLHGGRTPTGLSAVETAVRAAELGAGEILLTSMDADGVLAGYDLELTRAVARAVPVPVIASGGAGSVQHILEALTLGEADAALVASILHYGAHTITEIKLAMEAAGIPVRLLD